MLNNMLTSIGTLTFGQSLLLSGIGMLVVLLELAILAVMIVILSKVLGAVVGEKKAPAAAAAAWITVSFCSPDSSIQGGIYPLQMYW